MDRPLALGSFDVYAYLLTRYVLIPWLDRSIDAARPEPPPPTIKTSVVRLTFTLHPSHYAAYM
jgi:hypothetical protein